jgi:Lrp/AsnC family transcriptional regulator for asnA, asnC and gidA
MRDGTVDLDAAERLILAELQRDGRITTQELAKRVGVSEATARRKLRRLTREGIVHITGVVDPFEVGIESPAFVGVKVSRARLDAVARELAAHPQVRYVAAATGRYHLLVEVMATSNRDLARVLMEDFMAVDGVLDTETSLIIRIYKQASEWRMDEHGRSVPE